MSTRWFCDRCGAEVTGREGLTAVRKAGVSEKSTDLCKSCVRDFDEFRKPWPKPKVSGVTPEEARHEHEIGYCWCGAHHAEDDTMFPSKPLSEAAVRVANSLLAARVNEDAIRRDPKDL